MSKLLKKNSNLVYKLEPDLNYILLLDKLDILPL